MAEIPEREESSDGIDRASRAGFIQYAVERLFGIQEVERRISRADAAYYVGNLEDGEAIPRPARRAVAYLMQRGLWGPYPNNLMKPDETILRKDALSLVARCIQAIRPETIRTALLLELPGSSGTGSQRNIKLKSGRRSQTLTLADEIRLFHLREEQSIPARRLRVIGNEKVSYHLDKEGRIDFLEVALSATGAASDRFSPVATWNKTLTITEVSKKLSSLAGGVGRIGDIRPARIGKSGRAVQIEVIGSRGSKILNGYRVRGVLELRDTLFTIERSRNPDGTIRSFTFRGRGWGHGVGLCQVGAYGMARAGRSYREILKTYYTDVEIKKAY
jgi:stage II sporulation protein D